MASLRDVPKKLAVFFVLLLAWHLASSAGVWSTYVLPAPAKVGSTLWHIATNGELAHHTLISLRRVGIGFAISLLITFIFTLIGALAPYLVPYYQYVLGIMRHVPPIALIPLLILWFGIGETPKIIVIVLASVFPILLATQSAVFGCDRALIDVGRSMGMAKWRIFFSIMVPNALPQIVVGTRVGLGYAWRAIVAAEMIAAASGLGSLVLDAQRLSRTDTVIAGIIAIGVFGLLFDRLLAVLERRVSKGRGEVSSDARL